LQQGLAQDLSPTAHFLLRLRTFHPALALVVGGVSAAVALRLRMRAPALRGRAVWGGAPVFAQLALWVADFLLLAPVARQLAHLVLADRRWIAWVRLAAAARAEQPRLRLHPTPPAPLGAGAMR